MHKISFICLFLLGLSACATPVPHSSNPALLKFADLAAEITVQHEVIDSSPVVQEDANNNSVD